MSTEQYMKLKKSLKKRSSLIFHNGVDLEVKWDAGQGGIFSGVEILVDGVDIYDILDTEHRGHGILALYARRACPDRGARSPGAAGSGSPRRGSGPRPRRWRGRRRGEAGRSHQGGRGRRRPARQAAAGVDSRRRGPPSLAPVSALSCPKSDPGSPQRLRKARRGSWRATPARLDSRRRSSRAGGRCLALFVSIVFN